MLSNQKSFVVTVGNRGTVVALHHGNEIKNKIFLDDLTEEAKIDLKNLFTKNDFISVHIVLDTIDQSYKKKTYPLIRKSDLVHIVKRDLASDGDKESFKNFIILENKKAKKTQNNNKNVAKRDCLFVSASNSEEVAKWIDFLLDMPNHIVGIYMSPIESFKLIQLLKNDIRSKSKAKNIGASNIYFLILQNKVSGVRQIIFSEEGIVFTRCVDYDFSARDFLQKYEQDIYSTFEYLKRLIPDARISEIDVVNIFSTEILNQIKNITSPELNFTNYTPYEASIKAGYKKSLPENSSYCDLLISTIFSHSKKILKFSTPKISMVENYFIALKTTYYLNILLSFAFFIAVIFVFLFSNKEDEALAKIESSRLVAMQEYSNIKLPNSSENELTDNGSVVEIEKVIDFGKIDEAMRSVGTDVSKLYVNLRFLKSNDVRLNSMNYTLQNFDFRNPVNTKYQAAFKGELGNKSGDIDDLFKSFDTLTANAKKSLPKENVRFNEIPRNIDFVQKYYSFPIEFTVSN